MTVQTQFEVVGIKEALAELNTFDKKFRRGVTVRYKEIVDPMLKDAKFLVPKRAPMSGFNRQWKPQSSGGGRTNVNVLPWTGRESSSIKPFVSGKRPKTFGGITRNLAAFGIRWTDKTAVLFDASGQAKTAAGEQMVRTLGQRYGAPSRAMWRAYEQAGPDVQNEIVELVEDIMQRVGRNIKLQR